MGIVTNKDKSEVFYPFSTLSGFINKVHIIFCIENKLHANNMLGTIENKMTFFI